MRADLVPEKFQAEYILEALAPLGMAGKKILIPRAEQAREILPEGLRGMGARVVVAAAYQTLPDDSEKIPLLEKLKAEDRPLPDLYQFLHRPQLFRPLRPAGNPDHGLNAASPLPVSDRLPRRRSGKTD